MAKKPTSNEPYRKVISQNRRARFEYFIEETLEAGIMLTGSEVKSLRAGKANISEAFAHIEDNALYLHNMHIDQYKQATRWNHAERRPRKLLLHAKEIKRFIGLLQTKGLTMVPLSIYFNARNIVKVELGLAKGKKLHDKRETEKKRDWQRQKNRLLKGGNS